VRSFFDAPPAPSASPLEVLQAALDEIEKKVQPAGRGARVFPYTRVVVHVSQPDPDHAAIEAVFGQFDARVRERLAELRCDAPASLDASVVVSNDTGADVAVVRVECSSQAASLTEARAVRTTPALRLRVVKGQSDAADYTFTGGVIAIGRGAEPADVLGRVRRNDIAFGDVRDGVSETVARAHARIEFDAAQRAYLLFNESSSNPTFLLRAGRSLRVAPRDRRGVRMQTGDDLQLGRAILRVEIADENDG
jgi:hypothetical protein